MEIIKSSDLSFVSILAIGDIHFKSDNVEQTEKLRVEICKMIFSNKNIGAVVVLGDILHKHDKIDVFSMCRSIDFLSSIRKTLDSISVTDGKARFLWILIGNHDRPNNSTFLTEEHPFTALKRWKNTYVADKPLLVPDISETKNPASLFYKSNFLLVPYVPKGKFNEAIEISYSSLKKKMIEDDDDEEMKKKEEDDEDDDGNWYNNKLFRDVKCVFAHQEFKGCQLTKFTQSYNGDVYHLEAPLCVSGHIHEYGTPQKNIIYVGSPFFQGWINVDGSHLFRKFYSIKDDCGDDSANKKNISLLSSHNHTVSLFEFCREKKDEVDSCSGRCQEKNKKFKHTRIKAKNISQNILVNFDSCEDFINFLSNVKDSFRTKCLKKPYTISLLKIFGILSEEISSPDDKTIIHEIDEEKFLLKYVNKMKFKVKCKGRDEFVNHVSNSQARVDLSSEGISVIPELHFSSSVVTSSSLSNSFGGCGGGVEEEEKCHHHNDDISKTFADKFIEEVFSPFKNGDGLTIMKPTEAKFLKDVFPEL